MYFTLILSLQSCFAIPPKNTTLTMITEAFNDFLKKPKVKKLSLGNQPQRHVEEQTHTYTQQKKIHRKFEVLLLGTLGPSLTESTLKAFFPLHSHGLNKCILQAQLVTTFPHGFHSFCPVYEGAGSNFNHFPHLLDNFRRKNFLLLELLYNQLWDYVSQIFKQRDAQVLFRSLSTENWVAHRWW